jgi:hypothetical protein
MKRLLLFSSVFILLFSCGNDKNRTIQDQFSSFLNENDSVVLFGKVDFNQILNKTGYKQIPKFGTLISSVIGEFQNVINTTEPIYFSANGPFQSDGTPETFYGFLSVKNADSLVEVLTQKGYDFDKKGEMYFSQFDDVSLGISNHTAILISKKDDYDGLKYVQDAFERTNEKLSEGKVEQILLTKADILVGYSLKNAYKTSATKIEQLPEELKAEMAEMVDDSYGQLSFHFENGEARIKMKNYFSEKLKEHLFFNEDNQAQIIDKLGQGDARMGISMNIDMKKLQAFMNKYAPGAIDEIGKMIGGPAQMALMMGGDDSLAGLLSGEIGFVMFGEPDENGATEPNFNTYVGLGKKGKSIAQMASSFLEQSEMKTVINDKGIACYSSSDYEPNGGKLNLPIGCQSFGEKALTGFINVEGMDMTSFHFSEGAKILEIVKYISFEFDENGGEVIIKAKKDNVNILKQSVDFMLKEFESQINSMPF